MLEALDKLPVDEAAQAAGQRAPRVFAFAPQPTYQWHLKNRE